MKCLYFVLLLLLAAEVSADYTVQIGAFKDPDPEFSKAAAGVGTVQTSVSDEGLTRYWVGRYATRDEAESHRTELVAAGYADAFTTVADRRTVPVHAAESVGPVVDLSGLTDEERERVVYLDGKLHLKNGDEFIPLAQ